RGRSEPAERNAVEHHRSEAVVLDRVLDELGRHESGTDRVHRDPELPPLGRELLDERVEAALARGVRGEAAPAAGDAARRGEVDDATPGPAVDHHARGSL